MFVIGVVSEFEKLAAMDQRVHDMIATRLPKKASLTDELEDLLPEDGELETLISDIEEEFDIHLPSDVVFRLFADGTVADLEKAVVRLLVMNKTANHAYYMQRRAQMQQRSRQYRMRNLHQIRRKSRIYRKKVARRQVRPRRRVGTAGGGYSFLPR